MRMESLERCPSCGARRRTAVTGRGMDFTAQRIHRCDTCGLLFQSPRMDAESLRDYYASEFSRRFRGSVTPDAQALAMRDAIAAYRFDWLKERGILAPGRSLLELGCGAGSFLRLCERFGMAVWGVEPSEGYAAHARSLRLSVEPGHFPDARGGRERYDVVALFHVLEHLPRPRETLQIIRGMLEPGGTLVIEVPDIGRAIGPRWSERYFHAPHLLDFTEDSLRYLLTGAGFEIVAQDTRGQNRRRRHHLLVAAQVATQPARPVADAAGMLRLLLRLRFWIAVSRVIRPVVSRARRLRSLGPQ
jgi:2-polyprenyl-3-methyl-5-hydroxy-6-metoxy-1,4-benzoquinol methylase